MSGPRWRREKVRTGYERHYIRLGCFKVFVLLGDQRFPGEWGVRCFELHSLHGKRLRVRTERAAKKKAIKMVKDILTKTVEDIGNYNKGA